MLGRLLNLRAGPGPGITLPRASGPPCVQIAHRPCVRCLSENLALVSAPLQTPPAAPLRTSWSPEKETSSTTASSTWPLGTTTASTPLQTGLCPTGATSQVSQGWHVAKSYSCEPQTNVLSF